MKKYWDEVKAGRKYRPGYSEKLGFKKPEGHVRKRKAAALPQLPRLPIAEIPHVSGIVSRSFKVSMITMHDGREIAVIGPLES